MQKKIKDILIPIVIIAITLSCTSNNRKEDEQKQKEEINSKKEFLNISPLKFQKEKGTDFVIIYKDSNTLNDIRDSIKNELSH